MYLFCLAPFCGFVMPNRGDYFNVARLHTHSKRAVFTQVNFNNIFIRRAHKYQK